MDLCAVNQIVCFLCIMSGQFFMALMLAIREGEKKIVVKKGRPSTGQVIQVNARWIGSWFWVGAHTG